VLNRSRNRGRVIESHTPGKDNWIWNNGYKDRILGYFQTYEGAIDCLNQTFAEREIELTSKQACNYLGIDRETLNREVNLGRLACLGPRHHRRFHPSELDRWLAK
jgi:excisionase family DNA binding protein